MPAVISAVVLPRMVPHVAHRLMLTGEVFDAATAAAGGLVDLVVADDEVDADAARRSSPRWPPARRPRWPRPSGCCARGRRRCDFDELLELSARFFAGEEGQEGIASFREKRPARWVPAAD